MAHTVNRKETEPDMKTTRATHTLRIMLLVTASLALTACGFQPRGSSAALPASLTPLAITGVDADHPLYLAIQKRLVAQGSTLARDPAQAAGVIVISNVRSRTELLTVDGRNKTNEQELIESFDYRVRQGERESAPQHLSASRLHYVPGSAALARTREADTLRETLQGELADRLLRRLAAW